MPVLYLLTSQETALATSHLCTNGKWKPGPVADCPKHTRLSKKQPSVYKSREDSGSGSKSDSGSSVGSSSDSG